MAADMIVIGKVRTGSGRASVIMDLDGLAGSLGYRPWAGTLNLWVSREDRKTLQRSPLRQADGYLPCRVLNHPAHVHFPRGDWSIEIVGPVRFRDFVTDGDELSVEVSGE